MDRLIASELPCARGDLRRADHDLEALAAHGLDEHREVQQPAAEDLHSVVLLTCGTLPRASCVGCRK